MIANARKRFLTVRDAFGPIASSILVLFSAVAVSMFVFSRLTGRTDFTLFGYPWTMVESTTQAFIWFAFVAVYVVYSATSHRKFLNYTRKWWLEAIICVTWAPMSCGFFGITIQSAFWLNTLLLIGSLAHILRMAKWTTERFSQHAIIVIGVGTMSMVLVASAVLMSVEPETFTSLEETAYSVYSSALTMGPTTPPKTSMGRLVFSVISTLGVTTVALLIGVVREMVQHIFGHEDVSKQVLALTQATFEAVQKLPDLLQAILDAVQKQSQSVNQALERVNQTQAHTIATLRQQLASQEQTIAALREALAKKSESSTPES